MELQQQPSQDFLGGRGSQEEEVAWLGPTLVGGWYHALAGVGDAAGLVQEAAVFKLFTEPLQSIEWLIELHRHRHLRQVLADVVTQYVPQAHVSPRPTGRRQAAATGWPRSSPWNTTPWGPPQPHHSPSIQTQQALRLAHSPIDPTPSPVSTLWGRAAGDLILDELPGWAAGKLHSESLP